MKLEWDLTDLFNTDEDFYKEIENIREMVFNIKRYENL